MHHVCHFSGEFISLDQGDTTPILKYTLGTNISCYESETYGALKHQYDVNRKGSLESRSKVRIGRPRKLSQGQKRVLFPMQKVKMKVTNAVTASHACASQHNEKSMPKLCRSSNSQNYLQQESGYECNSCQRRS